MFRNLGKGYRMGGKKGNARTRAAKNRKGGGKGGEDEMMEGMMAMMMMGEMMSMGLDDDDLMDGFAFGGKMPGMPGKK